MYGGPYSLFGNPDDIAAVSPEVNKLANQLEARSAALQKRIDTMGFVGPKATRFRDEMTDTRRDVVSIARSLGEIADAFILASVHEAQRIAEWEAAMERAEEGPQP